MFMYSTEELRYLWSHFENISLRYCNVLKIHNNSVQSYVLSYQLNSNKMLPNYLLCDSIFIQSIPKWKRGHELANVLYNKVWCSLVSLQLHNTFCNCRATPTPISPMANLCSAQLSTGVSLLMSKSTFGSYSCTRGKSHLYTTGSS